jgi:fumarylacetoacetase
MASISNSSATPLNSNNVPYGIITSNGKQKKTYATVLGDFAVDLGVLHAKGIFHGVPGLDGNPFMRVNLITQTPTVILAAFRAQKTLKQD